MRKLTLFLLLVGCTGLGQHAAAAGAAYQNAFFTASNSPLFVNCRYLTDEEKDDADNMSGSGYNDGKWSGENPPNSEDEDGNTTYEQNDDPDKPTYDYTFILPWEDEIEDEWDDGYPSDGLAAQEVIEDDEGNIWIYEDDGSITVVST